MQRLGLRSKGQSGLRPDGRPGSLFAPDAEWAPTHRHRKGGLYRVLAHGVLEADRSDAVIYDDAEGVIWIRARAEFEDGRFTPLQG
ncbi:hypothetical protein So717_33070 [Roseobacter cerasinus]|uniref:DUF1653 domain-containing protein n=2 Tax=Roseobacter cerasinus TaxID=2602289 RepID=A0A640VVD2_9RHOB|nr:hypothetical protein So717_33070 [Roseobacter cerasinus]